MPKVSAKHTSKIQIHVICTYIFLYFFFSCTPAVSLKNIIVFESHWFYDIPRVPIRIRNVSSSSTLFWTHWRTWPGLHARAVNPFESEVPAVDLLWSGATGRHVDKLKHLIQKIQKKSTNITSLLTLANNSQRASSLKSWLTSFTFNDYPLSEALMLTYLISRVCITPKKISAVPPSSLQPIKLLVSLVISSNTFHYFFAT